MTTVEGPNHKYFVINEMKYYMVWDVLTIASPEGATVIVSNLSKPKGKRRVYTGEGFEEEVEILKEKGMEAAKADAGAKVQGA